MIRTAILGAGIGAQHLAALRARPEFHVVCVIDKDAARAEAMRGKTDTYAVETDIEAALKIPEIDLVDICLPPHLHVPVTLDALAAGKHVVCEKPLATSMADVSRIADAARKSARRVFPVFQYRWGPSLAQLRHLMESGLTGAAQTAAMETHWSRGAEYYAAPWRGTWAGERGGAVLGHAIHNHDLLTHIMGPIKNVSAMIATRVNPIETEDTAALIFRMESGALANSSITLGAAGDETRLRFVFERLTATSGSAPYAPGADPWTFTARDPSDQPQIDAALANCPAAPIGFDGFFEQVAACLNGQPNQAVRLQEGAASIALVTAIYHAARTGTQVSLPLPSDHPLYEGWLP